MRTESTHAERARMRVSVKCFESGLGFHGRPLHTSIQWLRLFPVRRKLWELSGARD